jgi:hypothetical protein
MGIFVICNLAECLGGGGWCVKDGGVWWLIRV